LFLHLFLFSFSLSFSLSLFLSLYLTFYLVPLSVSPTLFYVSFFKVDLPYCSFFIPIPPFLNRIDEMKSKYLKRNRHQPLYIYTQEV